MPVGVAQALDQLVCHVACACGGRAVRRPITLSLHVSLVLACFGAYVAVTVKMCVIVDLVVSRLVVVTAVQIIAAIRCRGRDWSRDRGARHRWSVGPDSGCSSLWLQQWLFVTRQC